MMACPDMEVEGKVMKAINEVKSFDVLSGGGIGFYSADGTLVMVLVKNKKTLDGGTCSLISDIFKRKEDACKHPLCV